MSTCIQWNTLSHSEEQIQCHLQQHDGPREDHTKSEKDKYRY